MWSNVQKRCCKPITQAPWNTIYIHQYNIRILQKSGPTAIHCTACQETTMTQRLRNSRHTHHHQCNRVMQGSSKLYDSTGNKNSNTRQWAHRQAVRTHTQWLAIDQSWGAEVQKRLLSYQSFRFENLITALQWKAKW